MTVGYLLGTFDLLNIGDLDVIAQAGSGCSRLVVGLHSDEAATALYGRRPVVPLSERVILLRHVRGVDEVVVHEESGALARADVTFVVDHESTPVPGAQRLTPRRQTSSVMLRSALARRVGEPIIAGAVA